MPDSISSRVSMYCGMLCLTPVPNVAAAIKCTMAWLGSAHPPPTEPDQSVASSQASNSYRYNSSSVDPPLSPLPCAMESPRYAPGDRNSVNPSSSHNLCTTNLSSPSYPTMLPDPWQLPTLSFHALPPLAPLPGIPLGHPQYKCMVAWKDPSPHLPGFGAEARQSQLLRPRQLRHTHNLCGHLDKYQLEPLLLLLRCRVSHSAID